MSTYGTSVPLTCAITEVENEAKLYDAFVALVEEYCVDIFIGYEVLASPSPYLLFCLCTRWNPNHWAISLREANT